MVAGGGTGGPSDELSAEDCTKNGMYWYGRGDLEAARAWWTRALEIDAAYPRARDCLKLLDRTPEAPGDTSTGWGGSTDSLDLALDLPSEDLPEPSVNRAPAPGPKTGEDEGTPDVLPPLFADPHTGGLSLDLPPLDGEDGPMEPTPTPQPAPTSAWDVAGAADPNSPTGWDQMPSHAPALTVSDQDAFDAVAEITPSTVTEASFDEIAALLGGPPPEREAAPKKREGGAAPAPAVRSEGDRLGAVRDRYRFHDFDGVIELAAQFPPEAPGAEEVRRLAAKAKDQLLTMYESKLGAFDRTPRVLINSQEVIWLSLNHRAGFILSQIDGTVTYEDLIALSGMSRLDTVRILAELLEQRVIGAD